MRIVLLGNFRVNYTSESDYKWTLEKMGHTVTPLQESEATSEQILEAAMRSDALMWVHTHGWRTLGRYRIADVLAHLRKKQIPTFGYHLDIWLGLPRQKDLFIDPYWRLEYFFTCDKEMADMMSRQQDRFPKTYYLPAAVIERDSFLLDRPTTYDYDVIFTGAYEHHREWPYRKKLVNWLHETYGKRFHRYGRPDRDQPDAKYIMGSDLNTVYANAKVVVGDSFCPNFKKTYYWSNRAFEVLGKGGFLIHPYIKGMEDYFTDKEHLVFYEFNNFEQLKKLIDYYLAHNEEREQIRRQGHEHVKANHTFTNRLKHMLEVINE